MPNVASILAEKGSKVLTISKGATVLEAARMMNENKCGSLLVTEDTQLLGIITERDVLSRVVAAERDPAATPVLAVMTQEIAVCTAETSIEEARTVMRNRRIRHLPVVDGHDQLVGVVSIGDLNAYRLEGQEKTIHLLHEYLYGQPIT
ncbi:MAG TPA: histidine kinase [Phycisphaerales bacterium]|nr:histidine kinase [Phycisphaerales bacterium]HCD35331.1 histidine kinase [Phycisphaerales bacterium]|tara:strand:+ start:711 stop:1154 length:444 start_codon:yes stop_codon:yes gene_type:complete